MENLILDIEVLADRDSDLRALALEALDMMDDEPTEWELLSDPDYEDAPF